MILMDDRNTLPKEDISLRPACNLCQDSLLTIGQKDDYGSVIICTIGNRENGWFATISPKTGGDPLQDFTIQLMPLAHLTHFYQVHFYPTLAQNYGLIFAKVSAAIAQIMIEEQPHFKPISDSRETAVSIAAYGKATTWKEKKEHLHLKIFPFRGNIGQPYTVDSTFGKKEIYTDSNTGEEYVKMNPVRKVALSAERFKVLAARFISLLSEK